MGNASTETALKLLMLKFEVSELTGGLDWSNRYGGADRHRACVVASQ